MTYFTLLIRIEFSNYTGLNPFLFPGFQLSFQGCYQQVFHVPPIVSDKAFHLFRLYINNY